MVDTFLEPSPLGIQVTPDEHDRMSSLCQRIATEQDRTVFLELVKELNTLLNQKQDRLTKANQDRGQPVQSAEKPKKAYRREHPQRSLRNGLPGGRSPRSQR